MGLRDVYQIIEKRIRIVLRRPHRALPLCERARQSAQLNFIRRRMPIEDDIEIILMGSRDAHITNSGSDGEKENPDAIGRLHAE